jgi:hypothetical protein
VAKLMPMCSNTHCLIQPHCALEFKKLGDD